MVFATAERRNNHVYNNKRQMIYWENKRIQVIISCKVINIHLIQLRQKVRIPMRQVITMKSAICMAWVLFFSYTGLMIYLLFFGFSRAARTERLYNLIPFKTIWSYIVDIQYYNLDIWVINLFGNVAAFIPFGFFIPCLFRHYTNWYKLMNLLFWALLLVETTQYIFKVGSFDVDDIILNMAGGLLGYWMYRITVGYIRRVVDYGHSS